jgi:hypothetical protein
VFTLELGDDGNRMIRVFTMQRTFRGRWSNRNIVVQHNLSTMPDIPGIHLTVNLRESKVTVSDPLNGDKKLCAKIRAAENQAAITVSQSGRCGIDGFDVPMNADQMKTLLLELASIVKEGSARVIKGEMPNEQEIKAMPGDELMDPHGVTPGQPMYVKDYWKFRGRNLGIPLSGDPAAMEASDARV